MRRGLVHAIVCSLVVLLAGCKRDPVTCDEFEVEEGTRPSRLPTSFDRPTRRFVWTQCTDRKTRMLQCRTATSEFALAEG